ncbi:MAG: preprotein translocase subunit SecA [bacterium]|nr:preprotein translocase subunit SecA [bacterium]
MIQGVLKKVFGSSNERELRRMQPLVEKINSLEPRFKQLSDAELRQMTVSFRERLEQGELLDSLLPEAFAVVREASLRTLGMRHFDVQLLGGIVLNEGRIAEMKTGEGKTLCATLPVYLNALVGRGVHLVTVNDYLARRDAEWMGQVYAFLGMTTGVVLSGMDARARFAAYRCDITYGQNNEFGFDYLRDNMKLDAAEVAQRDHYFAIVDEVDSILIDEARTPLIISGPAEDSTEKYVQADKLVRKLREGDHYEIELKSKQVTFTDDGVKRIEEILQIENLYEPQNIDWVHHVTQALRAHVAQKRDFDYVVRNGEVIIVDEFTGRLMAGRRWSDGLHQAVEAKEGVKVQRENQTLASVTFQNYFRMYEKLSGMTGTADTEAVEFKKIYSLDVSIVPTNRPMQRQDYPDVVYASEQGKFRAAVKEIEKMREKGRPVLVGTASIAKSEVLSELLKEDKIPHHVLNAKQHEREAEIVAQAGRKGAVTISTNMAGRGTDILLGGNPEFLAAQEVGTRDADSPEFQEALKRYQKICADEKQEVMAAGGLHILGTERHESRRIDNQLRGRSGRQGDPGSSRFYVSFEDDLMKRFGGDRMQSIMARVGMTEEDAIEGPMVAGVIERAQKKVEGYHFDVRKQLLEYDDVMNKQREGIYKLRADVLNRQAVDDNVRRMFADVIEELILSRVDEKTLPSSWDFAGMLKSFERDFGIGLDAKDLEERQQAEDKNFAQQVFDIFKEAAEKRYEERRQRFGEENFSQLERVVLLQCIDRFWKENLAQMDRLKEGIGLRGYGQKNPLHEYQREAFEMYALMMQSISHMATQAIFLSEIVTQAQLEEIQQRELEDQKRLEEMAKAQHQSVIEAEETEAETSPVGSNRRTRRQQEKKATHAGKVGK